MRNYLIAIVLTSILSSCSYKAYRVLQYKSLDHLERVQSIQGNNDYYLIKNSNYYLHRADSTYHYTKLYFVGINGGAHRTLVVDDKGIKYYFDAVINDGYYNDKYLEVHVSYAFNEQYLFTFVLDWGNPLDPTPKE